jgi:starvation-inducible outer membrane lipoprotein
MRPLILLVLHLLLTGCPSVPPQAKPSTPAGIQAHDPKLANDAQAASDAAAQMGILVADAFLGASKE